MRAILRFQLKQIFWDSFWGLNQSKKRFRFILRFKLEKFSANAFFSLSFFCFSHLHLLHHHLFFSFFSLLLQSFDATRTSTSRLTSWVPGQRLTNLEIENGTPISGCLKMGAKVLKYFRSNNWGVIWGFNLNKFLKSTLRSTPKQILRLILRC